MKRLAVVCALLACSPIVALAQEPAAASGSAGPTRAPIVAVIDIQRVTAESAMGQQLAADLQAVQQEMVNGRVFYRNEY